MIRAKNGFQLFSTIRTSNDSKKDSIPDLIGIRLWELIKVEVPDEIDLKNILVTKFPLLINLIGHLSNVTMKLLESIHFHRLLH